MHIEKEKRIATTFKNPMIMNPDRCFPENIAIIGSGTIGPDIGYYLKSALPNITLYMVDISDKQLILAEKRIKNHIIKAVSYKKVKSKHAVNIENNIIYTTDYAKLSNCDLVIEAATESLDLKQEIFSKIEKVVSKDAILTSNTSSIPADRIFNNVLNSSRTAVTHFFAPAFKNLLVEVVGWEDTDQSVVDFLCWFFAATGKVPIPVANSICFMLDRIFDNWCNEAACLLKDASAFQIDSIAEKYVSAGPFFVLNMAKGNSIIFEANSLQMEEGLHYKPSYVFKSVETWLTCVPGSKFHIDEEIKKKVSDRLLGIFFSQSYDIIDRGIGTLSDLNFGCEVALGFHKGPIDVMFDIGKSEVKRVDYKFKNDRCGFPEPKHSFEYYQDFKRFVLEDDLDGIKIITIRRPQVMNALNDRVTDEILEIFVRYSHDESVKGFILTGFGRKAFSAGADIGNFPKILGNYEDSVKYAKNCAKVQCFMDNMTKPVVAAINGLAIGGGLELAIRCHGIIAHQDSVFKFPEVKLGILPGIGGCIIPYKKWPKGSKIFNDMIILSKGINVEKAHEIGMVQSIVSDYNLLISESVKLLSVIKPEVVSSFDGDYNSSDFEQLKPNKELLSKLNISSETVSIIIDTIKNGVKEVNLNKALEIGYHGFGLVACTASAKEGISAFIEKRKAVFKI